VQRTASEPEPQALTLPQTAQFTHSSHMTADEQATASFSVRFFVGTVIMSPPVCIMCGGLHFAYAAVVSPRQAPGASTPASCAVLGDCIPSFCVTRCTKKNYITHDNSTPCLEFSPLPAFRFLEARCVRQEQQGPTITVSALSQRHTAERVYNLGPQVHGAAAAPAAAGSVQSWTLQSANGKPRGDPAPPSTVFSTYGV
jgi:hypothetical protein